MTHYLFSVISYIPNTETFAEKYSAKKFTISQWNKKIKVFYKVLSISQLPTHVKENKILCRSEFKLIWIVNSHLTQVESKFTVHSYISYTQHNIPMLLEMNSWHGCSNLAPHVWQIQIYVYFTLKTSIPSKVCYSLLNPTYCQFVLPSSVRGFSQ